MPREKLFTKQEIVKNALEIFWSNGYHQTSIQDLVYKIGINRASLYDTFGDKETLFYECFLMYRNMILSKIKLIFDESKSIREGFENTIYFLTDEVFLDESRKGCFMSTTYAELLPSKTIEVNNMLEETRSIFLNLTEEKLKKAETKKLLKKGVVVQDISVAMYSSIVGLGVLSKTNISHIDIKSVLMTHLNIFK